MQSLPNILTNSVRTFSTNSAYISIMAVAEMGNGPGRTNANCTGGNKFAVVAIEYFTRWIEAKPLATITSKTIKNFFWQNIVCRFGVPSLLTVDNGKQFDSYSFKEFCHHMGTKIAFASVYHP